MSVVNFGAAKTQMSLDSSRCDAMEKSRRYCNKHEGTTLSNIYSDTKLIHPVWSKVTKTPYETRAKLCQGYGRTGMKRSFISKDSPYNFFNPETVKQPSNRMDDRTASVTKTDVRADPRVVAMHVLPGGLAINSQIQTKKPHIKHRTFKHDGRTLLDPEPTDRSTREPIQWGPVPVSLYHDPATDPE